VQRSGTRERTITAHGVRVRAQINYSQLKDGTLLEVQMATLSGPGLAGVKVSDVIAAILDGERDDGYKVSEPKEVTVGPIKAKEYRLTKDKVSRRTVIFAAKPRIYLLNVGAEDAAKLDAETATTFLGSLVLVPPEVVKAQAKERAETAEAAGKENQEKYGAKWTTSLKDMMPPDAPVVGVIRGKEFKPDSVLIERRWLVFRQGEKGEKADVEVKVWLAPLHAESLENKTFEIPTTKFGGPHVELATTKRESFLNKYALKLTFGAKDADGSIPGTIYLCTPDAGKSFLAGKFTAKAK
jgi:hypothetical protein